MAEVNLLPPVLSASNFPPPSSDFTSSEHQRRLSNPSQSDNGGRFDPEKAFGDSGRRGSRSASDASQKSSGGAREEIKKVASSREGGLGETVEEEEDNKQSPSGNAEPTPTPVSNDIINKAAPLHIKVAREIGTQQMALTPGLDDTPFKFGESGKTAF